MNILRISSSKEELLSKQIIYHMKRGLRTDLAPLLRLLSLDFCLHVFFNRTAQKEIIKVGTGICVVDTCIIVHGHM